MAGRADEGDVLDAITRGKVNPVYCLHGEERYLVDRCLAALRAAVLGGAGAKAAAGASFNHDVFEAKETGLHQVLGAAKTLPMFAKRRMVVARGIDHLKAEDLEPLIPYLADPNPATCLVLLADKIDARLRVFQALRKAGALHGFAHLKDQQLPAWLAREASARKIKIDPDAVHALADAAGPDLGRLVLALDQVSLYAGPETLITREHVEDLVAETRERGVFELTKAIGEGNARRALALLANMLRNREAPLKIQFMLLRQLRQIWMAKELAAAGTPRPEIAAKIGLPPFFLDDALGPARRMPVAVLERNLARLHQADRTLKSSRVDPDLQITRLVMHLAGAAAPRAIRG